MATRTGKEKGFKAIASGPRAALDEAAAVLIGAGSPGVFEDAPFEPPMPFIAAAPLPKNAALIAYFTGLSINGRTNLGAALKKIGWKAEFKKPEPSDGGDWAEKWKRRIKAVRTGGFLVRPAWKKVKTRRGETLIVIDPGMAFGTGAHPSTAMSLKALDFLIRKKCLASRQNLLDAGTGSGILAIAAAKLGVKRIIGTDIDPEAIKVAAENAKINKVRFSLTTRAPGKIPGLFGLITANIQSNVLIALLPEFAVKVRPGGFIVLSGILKEEAGDVEDFYAAKSGFALIKKFASKEWATLVMRRKGQDK